MTVFSLSLLLSLGLGLLPAQAILQWQKGSYQLQGQLQVVNSQTADSEVYLVINPGSTDQTRFKLLWKTRPEKIQEQDGSKAEVKFALAESQISSELNANQAELLQFLSPFLDLPHYSVAKPLSPAAESKSGHSKNSQ